MEIRNSFNAVSDNGEPIDIAKLQAAMKRFRLKRNAVAITYCKTEIPDGYEPVNDVPCALIHHADMGKKVYVNREHHDCLVGLYHLGMLENASEYIRDGIYMTQVQRFYTLEAAKSNKRNTPNLPQGMFAAIAAAPLHLVEDESLIHTVAVICEPQYAMILAGAASTRIGKFPIGELGMSACASIFNIPLLENNSTFVIGDGGGRMHNHISASELFVIIPRDHVRHLIDVAESFKITPAEMRKRIRPSYFEDGYGATPSAQAQG